MFVDITKFHTYTIYNAIAVIYNLNLGLTIAGLDIFFMITKNKNTFLMKSGRKAGK